MPYADSIFHPKTLPTWLALGCLRLVGLLPYNALLRFGATLGRLGERVARRRRVIVDRNLALCFPELSDQERLHLRHRHFESVGMGILEFSIAWWWSDARLLPITEVEGRDNLDAAMRQRTGVILLTGHTTSLEVGGRILQSLLPIHAMYRPNENPVLQVFIEKYRPKHVEGVISRENPRLMIRTLRDGGAVWYGPDQNYGGKGHVFVDFFGIPAATNTATSRFAGRTRSVVLPVIVMRKPTGGYKMIIEPMLEPFPSGDDVLDARRFSEILEKWVRMAPEQYNWLHRRFRYRPEGEPPLY